MATAKNHHSPYDLDKTNAYSLFTCVKARHKLSKFPFKNDVAEPDKIPASLTWPTLLKLLSSLMLLNLTLTQAYYLFLMTSQIHTTQPLVLLAYSPVSVKGKYFLLDLREAYRFNGRNILFIAMVPFPILQ